MFVNRSKSTWVRRHHGECEGDRCESHSLLRKRHIVLFEFECLCHNECETTVQVYGKTARNGRLHPRLRPEISDFAFYIRMTMTLSCSLHLVVCLFAVLVAVSTASSKGDLSNPDKQRIQLVESERIEEYHKRNYTWPLTNYNPDTPGWKALMEERFRQVEEMEEDRYEGYIQTIRSAFLVPNFTEHGFGLARCPDDLIEALRQGIRDGLPTARFESKIEVIDGPRSWFIDRPDLTQRVLNQLRHYAEEWSGVELTPYRAYGFRLYRNESQLMMHVDKVQTHIISFILHIDSSDDAEPWPIFIEVRKHFYLASSCSS